jgi:hypothetical protein
VKNALAHAGVTQPGVLAIPATGERVLMALSAQLQPVVVLAT